MTDDSKPAHIRRLFPLLNEGEWERTSDATSDYNCAAWAVGVTDANWWPEAEAPEYAWPPGVRRDGTIEAFVEGYATLGYQICEDDGLEPEVEKLAIYVTNLGSPQHVARQLRNGIWTSKLGSLEDISHVAVRGLAGGRLGAPKVFLSRPRAE